MSTDNYASEDATQELLRIGKWPEPLRLAYLLEKEMLYPLHGRAADCLRKLHAELDAIKQALAAHQEHEPENEPHVSLASVQEDWGPGPHEYHSLPPAAPVQEPVYVQTRYVDEDGHAEPWGSPLDPSYRGSKWAAGIEMRLLYTTPPAAQPAPVQEPVGCEGAIVNGRVYADRLEHDYRFECEAGPLHLCNDWVEFRRCFEWLAQHTTPPAAQRQWVGLTAEERAEIAGFAAISDWHDFEVIGAVEAKLKEKNT
jgi:hypothetical protein